MNLYEKDIEKFAEIINRLDVDDIKLDLMDYDNQKEQDMFVLFIRTYRESNNINMLEELHRLCECEVIFNQIWSLDKNEFFRQTLKFDLNSVYGTSFLHEFVKQVQQGHYDYFNDLVAICSIKYFKTPKKAEEYFDALIERVKNVPGLDLENTIKQKNAFMIMFAKHKSLYICNQ